MFAICKTEAGKGLESKDVPAPKMGAGDVRIKVLYAGVCGTDMHIYRWDDWAQNRIKPPLILGHEFVGKIIDMGKHVTGYEKGQLVSAECHIVCGVCTLCRTDRRHLCEKTEIIGVDRRGAFCEEVVVPAENLWSVSKGIAPQSAAIFDPLGNAMHTVKTFPVGGKSVLITGAGAIGLAAVAMARYDGAKHITVVEPNAEKQKLAKELGADEVLSPDDNLQKATESHKPEVLLEMSGNQNAITAGLQTLGMGGQAAMLGLPSAPISLDLSELVIFKGLTLRGVVGRRMFETWAQVDGFVKENPNVPEKLISHIISARNFEDAFETLESGKAMKMVLDFSN